MKYVIGLFLSRVCGIADWRALARSVPNARMENPRMVAAVAILKECTGMRARKDAKL
jgi:hypothetical protein